MWASIWSQKLSNVGGVFTTLMDCTFRMLYTKSTIIHLRFAGAETARTAGGHSGAFRQGGHELNTTSFQPLFSVSDTTVSSEPAKNVRDCVGVDGGVGGSFHHELAGGL